MVGGYLALIAHPMETGMVEEEGDEGKLITLLIRGAEVEGGEMGTAPGIKDPIQDLPMIWHPFVENPLG